MSGRSSDSPDWSPDQDPKRQETRSWQDEQKKEPKSWADWADEGNRKGSSWDEWGDEMKEDQPQQWSSNHWSSQWSWKDSWQGSWHGQGKTNKNGSAKEKARRERLAKETGLSSTDPEVRLTAMGQGRYNRLRENQDNFQKKMGVLAALGLGNMRVLRWQQWQAAWPTAMGQNLWTQPLAYMQPGQPLSIAFHHQHCVLLSTTALLLLGIALLLGDVLFFAGWHQQQPQAQQQWQWQGQGKAQGKGQGVQAKDKNSTSSTSSYSESEGESAAKSAKAKGKGKGAAPAQTGKGAGAGRAKGKREELGGGHGSFTIPSQNMEMCMFFQ